MVTQLDSGTDACTDDDIALKEVGSEAPLLGTGHTGVPLETPALLPKRLRRGKPTTRSPTAYIASAVVLFLLILASALHTGALRRYRWQTPPVDPTLNQKLDELSPAQNRVRNWLLEQRLETMGGIGVGLSATAPLDPRPPLASHAHPFEFAGEYEGPGVYINGSREKYESVAASSRSGLD
ncbi:hypothetical protein BMF94_1422 [Rhodotorula taiwanensis]|uniref:Uncharacterized protein n=1 Tax=Rhodotorula taiwanensis TaxID=741276 RepID=A0A2S5BFI4_9BASI|nr:hypothetical protein BMF94_1422 [Rhodotorula taiwanensis]